MTCRLVDAGKSVLEVVVSLRACVWSFDLSRWGLGRLFAATVFTVPGHWRATGALVAALPAVLRVTAHDSRSVSYP